MKSDKKYKAQTNAKMKLMRQQRKTMKKEMERNEITNIKCSAFLCFNLNRINVNNSDLFLA